ncbi:MAG: SURF1 family protein [Alphaproteobacteria bacterium]|nr:SURF1 family protein [Alphaproteobacteria bacterium]
MQFRPTFWPTLITIPALVILVLFGYWQVQRLQWKTELIQELEIRGAGPAIPLLLDARISAEDLMFRRVTVTGHYMHEAEMRLLNRVRDGVPGINVFTPLVRANGGGALLVNRGWVPIDWPGTPIEDHDVEPVVVEVTGVVRIPDLPGWFTPANEPEKNDWYFIDLAGMSAAAGVLPFTDYYVFATGEKNLAGEPVPWLAPDPNEWRVDLPNNHLTYAITWFSLAGVLFIIYVIYHTRRRGPDDG